MEKSKIYYHEEQRMDKPWLWLIFSLVSALIFSYGLYQQLVLKKPWGENPLNDKGLIFVSVAVTLIFVIVYCVYKSAKMTVDITDRGIVLHYKPYIKNEIIFRFEEIESYHKKEYSLIKDVGGRGIKKRPLHKLTSYTVSGRKSVFLKMKSGRKVIIGTQRPEAFVSNLVRAMQNR